MTTRAPFNPNALVTERDFQKGVVHLARQLGYTAYHTWMSLHSAAGFPDLVLVRPAGGRFSGRTIYVECKRVGKDTSAPQQAWLDVLTAAGNEVYVWKPGEPDDEAIMHLLHAEQRP